MGNLQSCERFSFDFPKPEKGIQGKPKEDVLHRFAILMSPIPKIGTRPHLPLEHVPLEFHIQGRMCRPLESHPTTTTKLTGGQFNLSKTFKPSYAR